jgi:arylsulfatase A
MKRREFLSTSTAALGAFAWASSVNSAQSRRKPNFVIVLCDDLGYGDIEPTGGKTIPTPNLNRMAREGMLLTDYYAPQNICTSSRAGLLTGRYPIRTGLAYGAILQFEKRVLPTSEVTIPEALKPAGYVSGLFGKWHLGHTGDWQPTKHGFDRSVGIPYSHDMKPLWMFTDDNPSNPSVKSRL